MKLEQQVCSLQIAKKLKELGVERESMFGWQAEGGSYRLQYFGDIKGYRDVPAYTVAELGEMLPERGNLWDWDFQTGKYFAHLKWFWWCNFNSGDFQDRMLFRRDFIEETEADARAKMLIYLLENKLITL